MSSTTGLGHRLPLVPLTGALAARGHDVRWIGGPADVAATLPSGIQVTPAGVSERERHLELLRRRPDLASLPVGERRSAAFSTAFAQMTAPSMLGEVRALVAGWRPDVVVHEAAELAAPLVAAENGIPSVCHGFGEIVPEHAVRAAAEVLAPLWAAAGLEPDPYAGSHRGLYVDIYPPSLRGEEMGHVPRVQHSRPVEAPRAAGRTVYITFGTMFNQNVDALRVTVLGAAAVADDVLVTIGRGADAAALGNLPEHVRVEEFVPQGEVLPRCAAVVCHGGSGTVLAALAHGLPVVCVPQGADQFTNAANVERVGVGLQLLDPSEADVRAAVAHARTDEARAAARRMADEIEGMPPIAEVADAVEEHARG